MKVGDKVFITENAATLLGLEDGIEFTIVDILILKVDFPVVLNAPQFGDDWVEFFGTNEIIEIT
tara:strand:+ start:190631 stop:190822 length:192 start_codon:yes stop_codon:yes gene_type:complete